MEITIGRMEKPSHGEGRTERAPRTVEDLFVWQKAHEFTLLVYKITKKFPKHEVAGIAAQFRRAAVLMTSSMAEGYNRRNAQEKIRFFNASQSALEECRYHIVLCRDLKFIDAKTVEPMKDLIESVSRLLNSYCSKFENIQSKK